MNAINQSMTAYPDLLHQYIDQCPYQFPHPEDADPDGKGIVAIGGDLTAATLLSAYAQGLFPWFNDDDAPIAWWSPEPRCVIYPAQYKPSKSLQKQVKKSDWYTSVNQDFEQVITQCSLPRNYTNETWITDAMQTAYIELHELGFAFSVEVWDAQQQLVGGLYGLKMGGVFCGESMFHRASNASKIAFWRLNQLCTQTGVKLIDCQLENDHLISLGAVCQSRQTYLADLPKLITTHTLDWHSLDEQINPNMADSGNISADISSNMPNSKTHPDNTQQLSTKYQSVECLLI